jgi:selenophosphate synthase
MCIASGVGAIVSFAEVPLLAGARELLEAGMWAGGSQRNLKSVLEFVDSEVDEDDLRILSDAQTSGGLLVSLPPDSADEYSRLVPESAVIGQVVDGTGIRVVP